MNGETRRSVEMFGEHLQGDLRERAIARFLRLVVPVLYAVLGIGAVVTLLAATDQPLRLIPLTPGLLLLTVSTLLLKARRIVASGAVLVFACALTVLTGMTLSGGIHAPAFFGLIPTVVIAASLFGNRAGLIAAGLAVCTSTVFVVLEWSGRLPVPLPPSTAFVVLIHGTWLMVAFCAITIPIGLMNRALKESEDRRAESERDKLRAEAALHQSHQLTGLLDQKGTILAVNQTALAFIGATADAVIGEPIWKTPWWPEAEQAQLVRAVEAAASGERVAFKTWHMRIDGQKRIIDFCVSPYRNERGDVVFLLAEGRDVTKLVRTEEQLAHRERLESIGALAGGIAHDFNNMLSGIIGAVEVLDAKTDPNDVPTKRMLKLIFTSSERAAKLASKLLVFSRRQRGEQEVFDFKTLIEDTTEILRHTLSKSISVSVFMEDAPMFVMGDATQLENTLLNLAINARDAMPEGGTLTIEAATTDLDESLCRDASPRLEPGPYLVIAVRDTGYGIPTGIQKKVFEPFFTTKERGKGTGLGLSTSFGTITAHKGAMSLSSKPGRGTTVTIYLPLIDAQVPHGPEPPTPERAPRDRGLVLLIDDETAVREATRAMLHSMGYDVIAAENAEDGVALFIQRRNEVTLVVLDMMMPKMNGLETLRRIRHIAPGSKVIMSSTFCSDEALELLYQEGVDAFLEKPVTRRELVRAVMSALATG